MTWLVFSLAWVIWIIPEYDSTEKVKCYDKYGSEIIGQECKQVIGGLGIYEKLGFTVGLLALYLYLIMISRMFDNDEFI